MKYAYTYHTNLGAISIYEEDNYITNLDINVVLDEKDEINDITIKETDLIRKAYKELDEYLNKNRKKFDLPLNPKGTKFQLQVWNALKDINYGETKSYKDIAIAINNEKACRAVGNANNKNPIPIFIPCHRVIGADGSLVGFGCGLDVKKKLLEIEDVFPRRMGKTK